MRAADLNSPLLLLEEEEEEEEEEEATVVRWSAVYACV
jgi:hypothetical protein